MARVQTHQAPHPQCAAYVMLRPKRPRQPAPPSDMNQAGSRFHHGQPVRIDQAVSRCKQDAARTTKSHCLSISSSAEGAKTACTPSGLPLSTCSRTAITHMPTAEAICATRRPMLPTPVSPRVDPAISRRRGPSLQMTSCPQLCFCSNRPRNLLRQREDQSHHMFGDHWPVPFA